MAGQRRLARWSVGKIMHDNKLKILAIDDDEESLSLLKVIVEKSFSNVKFLQACDSVEGLKLARAENPDVVLLDVLMPVVDGFEVCRQFKANAFLVSIPIIFLTALAMDKELLAKALLAGVEGFLFKPIEEAALIAQIRVMARIKAVNDKESREKERLFSLLAERTQEVIEAEEGHQKAEDALK